MLYALCMDNFTIAPAQQGRAIVFWFSLHAWVCREMCCLLCLLRAAKVSTCAHFWPPQAASCWKNDCKCPVFKSGCGTALHTPHTAQKPKQGLLFSSLSSHCSKLRLGCRASKRLPGVCTKKLQQLALFATGAPSSKLWVVKWTQTVLTRIDEHSLLCCPLLLLVCWLMFEFVVVLL